MSLVFSRGRAWALAALAFTLPLSLAASNALWGAALLCGVGLWVVDPRSRGYRWTGLEIPWAVVLGLAALTALLSDRPLHSLGKMKREVLAAVFLLYAQFPSEGGAGRRFLRLFAAGAALAGLAGVLQVLLGFNDRLPPPLWAQGVPDTVARLLSHRDGRAMGFFSHPVTYGEVLLLGALVSLGLARATCTPRGLAAFVGAAGGLLASGTRAVWLAFPAALGLWAGVRRDRRVMAVGAALAIAGGAAFLLSPALRHRAASITDMKANESNRIRRGLWAESCRLIREHPLRGVGLGNLRIPAADLRWGGAAPGSLWTETHNVFLQMAVERGLFGLAAFLALLFFYGRLLWRAARADPVFDGVFFGFLGLVLAGLTESWTHDAEVMMSLYFLLGVAAAAGGASPATAGGRLHGVRGVFRRLRRRTILDQRSLP